MNKKDRENIFSNIERLAHLIDFNVNLENQIINKNIFTQEMIKDIKKISDKIESKKRFLFDLCRRGPDACDQLVEILYGIGQVDAAKILRPDFFNGNKDEDIVAKITSSPEIETPPFAMSQISQAAGGDPPTASIGTVASIENEDFLLSVQNCRTAFHGKHIYRMTSSPRGFALIFNVHKFENECYEERHGSQAEANRLRDVFTQLQFTVEMFDNPTKEEMKKTLDECRTKPDLHKHDCLIVIVLTHGHSGYCVGSDGKAFTFEDIIQRFNNENCPQLIGCPKLFFFSCCRGDNRDTGPKYRHTMEEAKADAKAFSAKIVPTANDMMICYSTIDGYVSWRNEESGSWFGTALCQSLMKYSHNQDLHYILTIASSMVTNKTTTNGEKQVMEHTFRGFTKLFYFNPGIPPIAANQCLNTK